MLPLEIHSSQLLVPQFGTRILFLKIKNKKNKIKRINKFGCMCLPFPLIDPEDVIVIFTADITAGIPGVK